MSMRVAFAVTGACGSVDTRLPQTAARPTVRATLLRKVRRSMSKPGVDPSGHEVEEVALAVGILPGYRLARRARCKTVRRALDDDEILVGAGGVFVVELVVADEVMRAHRGHENRHSDVPDGASRRVVARAPVDVVHRIVRPDGVCAQE